MHKRPDRSSVGYVCIMAVLLLSVSAFAERDRLYTTPDPAAAGGIRGSISSPTAPIEQILAIPPDDPKRVYKGSVSGPTQRNFSFEGLPMGKYDLVVIYKNDIHEGLRLQRGKNSLTAEDLKKIETTIQRSEPFFTKKKIYRAEGTTGRGNEARCVVTYLRDRPSDGGTGYRRTFKLVMMKDVGPGWQTVRARDLYPLYVNPKYAQPQHHYNDALNGTRVTNRIKDLGNLRLSP